MDNKEKLPVYELPADAPDLYAEATVNGRLAL
jgi:hypothetical protein